MGIHVGGANILLGLRQSVKRRRMVDQDLEDLECTPASGQGQAADLTVCRA